VGCVARTLKTERKKATVISTLNFIVEYFS